VAYDQYGEEMAGVEIQYSLVSPYAGVSIAVGTGVIAVEQTACPGSAAVKATPVTQHTTKWAVLYQQ